MTKEVRLQKVLAEAGAASRRGAEKLILERRVKVNSKIVAELGSKVRLGVDKVELDGRKLELEEKKIYRFHKPSQIITTLKDPQGRDCVGDYTKELPVRVFPVGRLDADVTGLLLLTNNGEYAQQLLHPKFEVPRTYWAYVEGSFGAEQRKKLLSGVELEWGMCRAEKAMLVENEHRALEVLMAGEKHKLGRAQGSLLEVVVAEGRKHFVKKLLAAVACPVMRLCRVSFGPFELGDLPLGNLEEDSFLQVSNTA